MIVSAWRSARSRSARRSAASCARERVDRAAQPQAHVGGDLVVARAAGVQALAGVADERGQPPLDVEVDVLVVERPGERAGARSRRGSAPGRARCRPGPAPRRMPVRREHARVGERAVDVGVGQAAVEADRRGVALDEVGDRLGEAAGPSAGGGAAGVGVGRQASRAALPVAATIAESCVGVHARVRRGRCQTPAIEQRRRAAGRA